MYTEKQVDDMLSQVEQEFEKALGSIEKNEEVETEVEASEELEVKEEVINKSEESSEESDYETVDELYASMNKSEKEAHYNSIKKAMFGESEKEVEAKEEPIQKSENEVEEKVIEEPMSKSENEVKLESENSELKKSLDTMNGLLGKLFNKNKAPEGKAITNTSYIAKSEDSKEEKSNEQLASMSKGEITSKLKEIDYTDLSKSDRTAINEFCLKNGSVDKIKHLIIKE